MEPDINPGIYGLPGYLSAFISPAKTVCLCSAGSTTSTAAMRDLSYVHDRRSAEPGEDVNSIRRAESAKGPGSFRNLFMYSPNGKDGIQIIHSVRKVAARMISEHQNVSRDDMMAAHRVPLAVMGLCRVMLGVLGMWRSQPRLCSQRVDTSAEAPSGIERLACRRCHAF